MPASIRASRPAAGGGRHVDVPPERLERWFANFATRHGATTLAATPTTVVVTAADGATAVCEIPFAPFATTTTTTDVYDALRSHVERPRRVGVLLVRLGGYAAGIFDGTQLQASKVGSKTVHGRNSNGGWSQHRYARRREGQVRDALDEAADVAARILTAPDARLDALVLGGEKTAVLSTADDPRLEHLRPLTEPRILDVPDPRLVVLERTPELFRAVRVLITDGAAP